ncbi:glycoside hydrolase family 15 protein [Agromyces salentinus]|uniref:Glycoside hydrolase family 15 protein n=1 Tax=Agromyces salentinus TaxID=269421 RepID=A0ABP4Z8Q2_9MICO|nr:glycoside hydrolase family 15 protein [Agromyces salentinus]
MREFPAIEDYALLADGRTAALVSREGGIDWLCLPRFDSPSVFAALIGGPDAGHWTLRPTDAAATSTREYDRGTFVLRTRWRSGDGSAEAEVIEFMPLRDHGSAIVRRVRGIRGRMEFRETVRFRFDYGSVVPWVRRIDDGRGYGLLAVAGPDSVVLRGPRRTAGDHSHVVEFAVAEGEAVDLRLSYARSWRHPSAPVDIGAELQATIDGWREWAEQAAPPARFEREVERSLLVLRALTHEDTGGIVAAVTTSLPEVIGGERNWDYRFVWLRDAALTVQVLVDHGYVEEAQVWRRWLLRAIAGDPADLQIMYDVAGGRRLAEFELPELSGHRGSRPVRVGNAASEQIQWDIFGEVMLALDHAREAGLDETAFSWPLQRSLLDFLAENWRRPDHGIWEIRGPEREFTHSRVMAWAAFDCGVRAVERHGFEGPVDRWRRIRDEIREEVLARGFDAGRNTFTQAFGSSETDAALLQLPQVGFVAADDPRMLGTVAAIEEDLLRDGLLLRYRTESGVDGLDGSEHPFLACSFWLVEQYATTGRIAEAEALMTRLCSFANDVGLLSEEYDVTGRTQMGNTPQALSHLSLVRAADAIARASAAPAVE